MHVKHKPLGLRKFNAVNAFTCRRTHSADRFQRAAARKNEYYNGAKREWLNGLLSELMSRRNHGQRSLPEYELTHFVVVLNRHILRLATLVLDIGQPFVTQQITGVGIVNDIE